MSTIVAVKKNGVVCIGADTQITMGETSLGNIKSNSKLFKTSSGWIGTAGYAAIQNNLEEFVVSNPTLGLNTKMGISKSIKLFTEYLIEECFFTPNGDESVVSIESTFLVTTQDDIFIVTSDMCVLEVDRFIAIGSGKEYALGAMDYIYRENNFDAKSICQQALEVACTYDIYSAIPLEIRT